MEKGVFSFGIAVYNNYKYLREAVDSVLGQTYQKIQLIISNDGSKDFDEDEIAEYIEKHKKNNIVSCHIHNNDINQGTVKNVNYICSQAYGEYIMFMAADDSLYDENVLERFVEKFKESGDDTQILSAKVALCGEDLGDVREIFPQQSVIELITSGDNKKMFSRMTYDSFMPTTSTCYRMSVLEETGFFNEKYFIIEDASKFLQLAKGGYHFGWINDLIAARHRDGGISHGNNRNHSESYRRYRFDEIVLYLNEILPYMDELDHYSQKKMTEKWEYIETAYFRTFFMNKDGVIDSRDYDKEIFMPRVAQLEKKARKEEMKEIIKNRAQMVSLKQKLKSIIILSVLFLAGGMVEKLVKLLGIEILGRVELANGVLAIIYICLFILFLEALGSIVLRILWDINKIAKKQMSKFRHRL